MCLLVNQKLGNSFSDEWLKDFFDRNDDGIGVMWAEDNVLYTHKLLPKTEQELIDFYRNSIEGKECSFHLRMRTHGDTDLENCHPYQVFSAEEGYPLYLMHNGILATGNSKDTSKSDTWHYIQDIIRPALMADKTQFMEPWFKTLIEKHIGANNKFVMMDAYGNTVTFNEGSGVDWDGNWMSNTYAWSAGKAGVIKSPKPYSREDYDYEYGGYGRGWGYGYGGYGNSATTPAAPLPRLATVTPINPQIVDVDGNPIQGKLLGDDEGNVSQRDNDSPPRNELRTHATHDEIREALDYADIVFEDFDHWGMEQAAAQLTLAQAANLWLDDERKAYKFLDDLEAGNLTEAAVFEHFGVEPEIELEDTHLKAGMQ